MANLLDLVKNIADVDQIKDVLPKGPEGLKQLRDVESAVSSAASQAQSAMQQMMQQAGQALGSLTSVMSTLQTVMASTGRSQAAPTVPTGSFAATHEESAEAMDQALENLTAILNTLQTVESALACLNNQTAPISAFDDHEEFLTRFQALDNVFDTLTRYSMALLTQNDVINLCSGLTNWCGILAAVPEEYVADYNLSRMVYALPVLLSDLNFYGMDLAILNPPATTLIAALEAADAERLGTGYAEEMVYAATILAAKLNQSWTLTDTEACTLEAVNRFYPRFLALLRATTPPSYLTLTGLLQEMMDAIAACSATKALGAPMGQSSAIPQIGGMIDSTLSDFISKGINDASKVRQAIEKFTKKQHIVEQKRQIVKGQMTEKDNSAPAATTLDATTGDVADDPLIPTQEAL